MVTLSPKVTEALTFSTPPSDPRDMLAWQLLKFAADLLRKGEIYNISPDLNIVHNRLANSDGLWPHLFLSMTPEEGDMPLCIEVDFTEHEARMSRIRGQLWLLVSVSQVGMRQELIFPATELPGALESLQGLIKAALFQNRVLG